MKLPQLLSTVILFSVFLTACESIPRGEQAQTDVQTEKPEEKPIPVMAYQWQQGKQQLLADLRSSARLRVQEPDEQSIYIQIRSTDSFLSGGSTPSSELLATLEHISASVEGRDYIEILVSGHTDNVGNARRNLELSAARAKVVADYLVEKGVKQPITHVGSGSEQPVASNATREGRAVNRRIDLLIKPSPDEVPGAFAPASQSSRSKATWGLVAKTDLCSFSYSRMESAPLLQEKLGMDMPLHLNNLFLPPVKQNDSMRSPVYVVQQGNEALYVLLPTEELFPEWLRSLKCPDIFTLNAGEKIGADLLGAAQPMSPSLDNQPETIRTYP